MCDRLCSDVLASVAVLAREMKAPIGLAPAGRVVCTGMNQTQTKLPMVRGKGAPGVWPSKPKEKRLQKGLEPLGLFDDAPVSGGAERCANSKDVLALDDVKRLIEDDRRERKALKKDKKRSLREGQKGTSKPERRALGLSEGSRGVTMFDEVIYQLRYREVRPA